MYKKAYRSKFFMNGTIKCIRKELLRTFLQKKSCNSMFSMLYYKRIYSFFVIIMDRRLILSLYALHRGEMNDECIETKKMAL